MCASLYAVMSRVDVFSRLPNFIQLRLPGVIDTFWSVTKVNMRNSQSLSVVVNIVFIGQTHCESGGTSYLLGHIQHVGRVSNNIILQLSSALKYASENVCGKK